MDRFRIHEGYADPDEENVLDFNEMLVINALNYCTAPYNKYSAVENLVTACHCDVPHASADIEHQYHTVEESGVLKQTMFTFEEAKREMEEEKYIGQFCKLAAAETKTKCLNSKDGKLTLLSKIKELKKSLKSTLKDMKLSLITLKQESSAQESEYKLMKSRGEKFDRDPSAIEAHGFSNRKNKERIMHESLEVFNKAQKNVKDMERDIATKKKQKKNNKKKWKEDGLKVLMEEAIKQTSERMLDEGRTDAMKNNWRRPWDGEDGHLFKVYAGQKTGDSVKKTSQKDDPEGEDGYSSNGDETDQDEDSEEESEYYDDSGDEVDSLLA